MFSGCLGVSGVSPLFPRIVSALSALGRLWCVSTLRGLPCYHGDRSETRLRHFCSTFSGCLRCLRCLTPFLPGLTQPSQSSAGCLKRSEGPKNPNKIASVGKYQNEVGRASTRGRWANSYKGAVGRTCTLYCHNIAATDPAEFVRSGNDLVLRRIFKSRIAPAATTHP